MYFVAAQRGDHALDVTPVTEAEDVAVATALLGTGGGLEARIVAIALDQVRRVGESDATVDEGRVHGCALAARRFATADKCRQRRIDHVRQRARGFDG